MTPTEQARLRKIQKKIKGPALAIDTDLASIHSDEPDAPSSPLTISTTSSSHGVPLFPCLKVPTRILRGMTQPEQLEGMKTIIPVFCSAVGSITKNISISHFLLSGCEIYVTMEKRILCKTQQLGAHVEGIPAQDVSLTSAAMAMALESVESILQDLPILLRMMETYHRMELKPLPVVPSPEEESPVVSSPEEEPRRAPSDTDALVEPSVDPEGSSLTEDSGNSSQGRGDSSPESPTSDATDSTLVSGESPAQNTLEKKKHKLIRRILQKSDEPKNKSLSKRPTLAVTNPDASAPSSTTTLAHPEAGVVIPYIVRQSCIYDRADPLRPDVKVDMPLPDGDTVAIRLDSNGDVLAATLPALIQLLTSHHDLDEDAFCETFFLGFRLFSSPPRVFLALKDRWDEPVPATGLTAAQRRVWIHHVRHVRTRVAELVLTWLDEYWRSASDDCMLVFLRPFIYKRMAHGAISEELFACVIEALDCAQQKQHTSRLQRARAVRRKGVPPLPATNFNLILSEFDDYAVNLSVFETAGGRERFAEQLTDLAHRSFRTIDPEEAVTAWVKGRPTFFELQRYEEELLFWVAQSILELQAREERVAMIEFWLDVATICVTLRNFSSASAIFGGLVFSPVERLSLTILNIAIPSKEQYRKLNAMFNGTNNFAVYRRAFAENNFPAVPYMTVLHKDAVSANEISGPLALTNDPDAEKKLIHFSAFRILQKTICTMEDCLLPYRIDSVPIIQNWICAQLAVLPHAEHAAISRNMDALRRVSSSPALHFQLTKGETWLQTVKGSVESGSFTLRTLPDPGAAPFAAKLRKNKSIATLLNLRTRKTT
ncbi:ras guanine nucleotide exchange factor domain-containing protein [Mycena maculata]|uniref:Ras guanine nucleotide exchange factor domain-containing protein n=1 Tax=Mycena maculata TaxID=230809 RepID=A0AAD7JE88_9AGAR|nr:ras guanine nucleotide exchange factor domain-containing protein [Mycena maculata]